MEKAEAKIFYINGGATTVKSAANGISLLPVVSDPAADFNNGRNQTMEKAEESLLKKLFCKMLNDVYNAEKQLLDGLPGLQAAATTLKLKKAFELQLQQTARHIDRLERIFELIDKKMQEKTCAAMEGLITESKSMIRDTKDGTIIRDIALIVASQKIGHYEITTYANLVQLALITGLATAAEVLDRILMEEEGTDELLSRIADILINIEAGENNSVYRWNT